MWRAAGGSSISVRFLCRLREVPRPTAVATTYNELIDAITVDGAVIDVHNEIIANESADGSSGLSIPPGHTVTLMSTKNGRTSISGNLTNRIIHNEGHLVIQDIDLKFGRVVATGGSNMDFGGAILNFGSMVLESVSLEENRAFAGDVRFPAACNNISHTVDPGSGGAVMNTDTGNMFFITSAFRKNCAPLGSAIRNAGAMTLVLTHFSENEGFTGKILFNQAPSGSYGEVDAVCGDHDSGAINCHGCSGTVLTCDELCATFHCHENFLRVPNAQSKYCVSEICTQNDFGDCCVRATTTSTSTTTTTTEPMIRPPGEGWQQVVRLQELCVNPSLNSPFSLEPLQNVTTPVAWQALPPYNVSAIPGLIGLNATLDFTWMVDDPRDCIYTNWDFLVRANNITNDSEWFHPEECIRPEPYDPPYTLPPESAGWVDVYIGPSEMDTRCGSPTDLGMFVACPEYIITGDGETGAGFRVTVDDRNVCVQRMDKNKYADGGLPGWDIELYVTCQPLLYKGGETFEAAGWEAKQRFDAYELSQSEANCSVRERLYTNTWYDLMLRSECIDNQSIGEWLYIPMAVRTHPKYAQRPLWIEQYFLGRPHGPYYLALEWTAQDPRECTFENWRVEWALDTRGRKTWYPLLDCEARPRNESNCTDGPVPSNATILIRACERCTDPLANSKCAVTNITTPVAVARPPFDVVVESRNRHVVEFVFKNGTVGDCQSLGWVIDHVPNGTANESGVIPMLWDDETNTSYIDWTREFCPRTPGPIQRCFLYELRDPAVRYFARIKEVCRDEVVNTAWTEFLIGRLAEYVISGIVTLVNRTNATTTTITTTSATSTSTTSTSEFKIYCWNYTCPIGYLEKEDFNGSNISWTLCPPRDNLCRETCCDEAANCSNYTCWHEEYIPKENQSDHYCAKTECSDSDLRNCCRLKVDPNTTTTTSTSTTTTSTTTTLGECHFDLTFNTEPLFQVPNCWSCSPGPFNLVQNDGGAGYIDDGTVALYEGSPLQVDVYGPFLYVGSDRDTGICISQGFALPPRVSYMTFLRAGGSDPPDGLYLKTEAGRVLCGPTALSGTDTDAYFMERCDGLDGMDYERVYLEVENSQVGGWKKVFIDEIRFFDTIGANLTGNNWQYIHAGGHECTGVNLRTFCGLSAMLCQAWCDADLDCYGFSFEANSTTCGGDSYCVTKRECPTASYVEGVDFFTKYTFNYHVAAAGKSDPNNPPANGLLQACLANSVDVAPVRPPPFDGIGVTCCSLTAPFRGVRPSCDFVNVTWEQAVESCASQQMRICTLQEIQEGAGWGSGCDFDDRLVWTSDECATTTTTTSTSSSATTTTSTTSTSTTSTSTTSTTTTTTTTTSTTTTTTTSTTATTTTTTTTDISCGAYECPEGWVKQLDKLDLPGNETRCVWPYCEATCCDIAANCSSYECPQNYFLHDGPDYIYCPATYCRDCPNSMDVIVCGEDTDRDLCCRGSTTTTTTTTKGAQFCGYAKPEPEVHQLQAVDCVFGNYKSFCHINDCPTMQSCFDACAACADCEGVGLDTRVYTSRRLEPAWYAPPGGDDRGCWFVKIPDGLDVAHYSDVTTVAEYAALNLPDVFAVRGLPATWTTTRTTTTSTSSTSVPTSVPTSPPTSSPTSPPTSAPMLVPRRLQATECYSYEIDDEYPCSSDCSGTVRAKGWVTVNEQGILYTENFTDWEVTITAPDGEVQMTPENSMWYMKLNGGEVMANETGLTATVEASGEFGLKDTVGWNDRVAGGASIMWWLRGEPVDRFNFDPRTSRSFIRRNWDVGQSTFFPSERGITLRAMGNCTQRQWDATDPLDLSLFVDYDEHWARAGDPGIYLYVNNRETHCDYHIMGTTTTTTSTTSPTTTSTTSTSTTSTSTTTTAMPICDFDWTFDSDTLHEDPKCWRCTPGYRHDDPRLNHGGGGYVDDGSASMYDGNPMNFGLAGKFLFMGGDQDVSMCTSEKFRLPGGISEITWKRSGGADPPSGVYLYDEFGTIICPHHMAGLTDATSPVRRRRRRAGPPVRRRRRSGPPAPDQDYWYTDRCSNLEGLDFKVVYLTVRDVHNISHGLWGKVVVDDFKFLDSTGSELTFEDTYTLTRNHNCSGPLLVEPLCPPPPPPLDPNWPLDQPNPPDPLMTQAECKTMCDGIPECEGFEWQEESIYCPTGCEWGRNRDNTCFMDRGGMRQPGCALRGPVRDCRYEWKIDWYMREPIILKTAIIGRPDGIVGQPGDTICTDPMNYLSPVMPPGGNDSMAVTCCEGPQGQGSRHCAGVNLNWHEAVAHCYRLGKRLCRSWEILDGSGWNDRSDYDGEGCGFDEQYVWTADTCSTTTTTTSTSVTTTTTSSTSTTSTATTTSTTTTNTTTTTASTTTTSTSTSTTSTTITTGAPMHWDLILRQTLRPDGRLALFNESSKRTFDINGNYPLPTFPHFTKIGLMDPNDLLIQMNDGSYWFKLVYSSAEHGDVAVEFRQKSWPTSPVIEGFRCVEPVDCGPSTAPEAFRFHGLGLSNSPHTVFDGGPSSAIQVGVIHGRQIPGFNARNYTSVELYINRWSEHWAYDGCSDQKQYHGVRAMPWYSKAAVRCCSLGGDECITVLGPNEDYNVGCFPEASFEEARDLCEDRGYRLCTLIELMNKTCCGTGCGFDSYLVWSNKVETTTSTTSTTATTTTTTTATTTTTTTATTTTTTSSSTSSTTLTTTIMWRLMARHHHLNDHEVLEITNLTASLEQLARLSKAELMEHYDVYHEHLMNLSYNHGVFFDEDAKDTFLQDVSERDSPRYMEIGGVHKNSLMLDEGKYLFKVVWRSPLALEWSKATIEWRQLSWLSESHVEGFECTAVDVHYRNGSQYEAGMHDCGSLRPVSMLPDGASTLFQGLALGYSNMSVLSSPRSFWNSVGWLEPANVNDTLPTGWDGEHATMVELYASVVADHYAVDGCSTRGEHHLPQQMDFAAVAGVRCCSLGGDRCISDMNWEPTYPPNETDADMNGTGYIRLASSANNSSNGTRGNGSEPHAGCPGYVTFQEATKLCENKGMRLCTWMELQSGHCCGTGCDLDNHLVWTRDPTRDHEFEDYREGCGAVVPGYEFRELPEGKRCAEEVDVVVVEVVEFENGSNVSNYTYVAHKFLASSFWQTEESCAENCNNRTNCTVFELRAPGECVLFRDCNNTVDKPAYWHTPVFEQCEGDRQALPPQRRLQPAPGAPRRLQRFWDEEDVSFHLRNMDYGSELGEPGSAPVFMPASDQDALVVRSAVADLVGVPPVAVLIEDLTPGQTVQDPLGRQLRFIVAVDTVLPDAETQAARMAERVNPLLDTLRSRDSGQGAPIIPGLGDEGVAMATSAVRTEVLEYVFSNCDAPPAVPFASVGWSPRICAGHAWSDGPCQVPCRTGAQAEGQLLCNVAGQWEGSARCVPNWQIGQWSDCLANQFGCGQGLQRRPVICPAGEGNCAQLRPEDRKACYVDANCSWDVRDWAECSTSCGRGTRERIVRCPSDDLEKCAWTPKPIDSMECEVFDTCGWKADTWTMCSIMCGLGTQSRNVTCQTGNPADCNATEAPKTVQRCRDISQCAWHVAEWSACSNVCGRGHQTRVVRCPSGFDDDCPEPEPEALQECYNIAGCSWQVGLWSKCEAGCGPSKQNRTVTCPSGRAADCHGPRPVAEQGCYSTASCSWTTGSWAACSNTCGHGNRTRSVGCASGVDSDCAGLDRPSQQKVCYDTDGCEWQLGDWSACSASCGPGLQTRRVVCPSGTYEDCGDSMPTTSQACYATTGCTWHAGDWSSCSEVCGTGNHSRAIMCSSGKAEDCHAEKPDAVQECRDTSGCGWVVGAWSACDATCGAGLQTRTRACETGRAQDCTGDGPATEQSCYETSDCSWVEGEWSVCSGDCGSGTRSRDIACASGVDADCQGVTGEQPVATEACYDIAGCEWQVAEWGVCSNLCGNGMHVRDVWCPSGSNADCGADQPPTSAGCKNVTGCEWRLTEWSECSSGCGLGSSERSVYCQSGTDKDCLGPKPEAGLKECHGTTSCSWLIGSWSACSVQCGSGYQNRQVACASGRSEDCDGGGPATRQACFETAGCEWSVGEWSECSQACGPGVRVRDVQCSGEEETDCSNIERPLDQQTCGSDMGDCEWMVEEWKPCSATQCGSTGTQTREVQCPSAMGEADCAAERPSMIRDCNATAECTWQWSSDWSECGAVCGFGEEQRRVSCSSGLNKDCDAATKPEASRSCHDTSGCGWSAGEWSACSAGCGEGVQERETHCVGGATECSGSGPIRSRSCYATQACEWTAGQWGACSALCGSGLQNRSVTCSSGLDQDCAGKPRPVNAQECQGQTGCMWTASAWSVCSSACGDGGTQSRDVVCPSGREGDCEALAPRPAAVQPCPKSAGLCAWQTGPWGACSALCGGFQRREVWCPSSDATACSDMDRPAAERPCQGESQAACEDAAKWTLGTWSECSVACGTGERYRDASCTGPDGDVVAGCDGALLPQTQESCRRTDGCSWAIGDWSSCSSQCGAGTRERMVSCPGAGASASCGSAPRPVDMEECREYGGCQWQMTEWSQCSAPACIPQTRAVTCSAPGGEMLCAGEAPARLRVCPVAECSAGSVGILQMVLRLSFSAPLGDDEVQDVVDTTRLALAGLLNQDAKVDVKASGTRRLASLQPQSEQRRLQQTLVELQVTITGATPAVAALFDSVTGAALISSTIRAQLIEKGFQPLEVLPSAEGGAAGSASGDPERIPGDPDTTARGVGAATMVIGVAAIAAVGFGFQQWKRYRSAATVAAETEDNPQEAGGKMPPPKEVSPVTSLLAWRAELWRLRNCCKRALGTSWPGAATQPEPFAGLQGRAPREASQADSHGVPIGPIGLSPSKATGGATIVAQSPDRGMGLPGSAEGDALGDNLSEASIGSTCPSSGRPPSAAQASLGTLSSRPSSSRPSTTSDVAGDLRLLARAGGRAGQPSAMEQAASADVAQRLRNLPPVPPPTALLEGDRDRSIIAPTRPQAKLPSFLASDRQAPLVPPPMMVSEAAAAILMQEDSSPPPPGRPSRPGGRPPVGGAQPLGLRASALPKVLAPPVPPRGLESLHLPEPAAPPSQQARPSGRSLSGSRLARPGTTTPPVPASGARPMQPSLERDIAGDGPPGRGRPSPLSSEWRSTQSPDVRASRRGTSSQSSGGSSGPRGTATPPRPLSPPGTPPGTSTSMVHAMRSMSPVDRAAPADNVGQPPQATVARARAKVATVRVAPPQGSGSSEPSPPPRPGARAPRGLGSEASPARPGANRGGRERPSADTLPPLPPGTGAAAGRNDPFAPPPVARWRNRGSQG
eukprot:TRINITY_DN5343_c4_g1_i1.p1 TRINITY_DN5343_c4_g1~~TRINITY_DN5343_c4_g1_i1.p1  ORF type:complete len:5356 (-),score=897.12 TRINITY_DN5343_c4_g1_i1:93-15986(-)